MLQQFIKKTTYFLEQTDLKLQDLNFINMEVDEEGQSHYYYFTKDNDPKIEIKENFLFHALAFFSFVDAKIDKKYPYLEGKSMSYRYHNLPSNEITNTISKECYRILKIIRSASVHVNFDSPINENKFHIIYELNDTCTELKMNLYGLELIYTFLLGGNVPINYPEKYIEAIYRGYYEEILKQITNVKDEFGIGLQSLSNGLSLKNRNRLVLENTHFDLSNDSLMIKTIIHAGIYDLQFLGSGLDFYIEIQDKKYVVPVEALRADKTILLEDLAFWELR